MVITAKLMMTDVKVRVKLSPDLVHLSVENKQ